MDSEDAVKYRFFTKDGNDVYKLESFYSGPSCTLVNMETGEKINFGIGSRIGAEFYPLSPKFVTPQMLNAEVKP